jgi:hypothetical protein
MGQPQVRGQCLDPGMVTCGDDLRGIVGFLPVGHSSYSVGDVIAKLLDA